MAPTKNCDHPKRKLDINLVKVVDGLQKFKDVNVSYHLVVHMEGHTQSFGTDNVSTVYDANKEQFEKALIDDALDLCDRAGKASFSFKLDEQEGKASLPSLPNII